jgi:hypothetical protein
MKYLQAFRIFTVVLRIEVFLDMTPCRLVSGYQGFGGVCFHQNIGISLQVVLVLDAKITEFSM